MGVIPHYVQTGNTPAISGVGFGLLGCRCGQSLLIAGYEPRNFLNIAIECTACGAITETPGFQDGAAPPTAVVLIARGTRDAPASIDANTVLISREEFDRLANLYQPRPTHTLVHTLTADLLDDIDFQQSRWTEVALDPAPTTFHDQALAWAVQHFRTRLRDPDWTTFANDTDTVAMTVICAFRDLFGSWVHHPLFGAMVRTAGAQGFSLHAMAMFGAGKAMAMAGNRIGHVASEGPRARIVAQKLALDGAPPMSLVVTRFDQFEWPNGGKATQQGVAAAVTRALEASRGQINRLHPGILVLSSGASDATFDRYLTESAIAAVAQQGKRYRGLAALAFIMPKISLTGNPREAKFGYTFYPVPNRADAAGNPVRVGTREDYAGIR